MPDTAHANSAIRPVVATLTAQPTMEGAGVKLKRGFGYNEVPRFDPFLLFDDFGSPDPKDYKAGFPMHPHRGIETITYVLAGAVTHRDSTGSKGTLTAGAVQWMTAGSGILHEEMPAPDAAGRHRGIQLWLNLPSHLKMTPPRYQEFAANQFPVHETEAGVRITVIAGSIGSQHSPIVPPSGPIIYFDIRMPPNARFAHDIPPLHNAFAYVVEGSALLSPSSSSESVAGTLVRFGQGTAVGFKTGKLPAQIIFCAGQPLGEPVAWHGPIVMNTREEIQTAVEDLHSGRFIRVSVK